MASTGGTGVTALRGGLVAVVVGLVLVVTRQVSGADEPMLESTTGLIGVVALVGGLVALAVGFLRVRRSRVR